MAGVLAVSIAAFLFAGCGRPGVDTASVSTTSTTSTTSTPTTTTTTIPRPVVSIKYWCEFLITLEHYRGGVDECVADRDVLRQIPTSAEEVEADSAYWLLYWEAENACFEDLKREAYLLRGSPYSFSVKRDDPSVRSCASKRMTDIKFNLLLEEFGVTELFGILLQLENSKPAQPDGGYVIDGDVYNDPWGLDYRNDSSDVYGDGR